MPTDSGTTALQGVPGPPLPKKLPRLVGREACYTSARAERPHAKPHPSLSFSVSDSLEETLCRNSVSCQGHLRNQEENPDSGWGYHAAFLCKRNQS